MKSFRQSLLQSFETCPRRALHGMLIDDDLTVGHVGAAADLGSAFHAVAAEILRTLYRQGESQMPTQEAIECMYEVLGVGAWSLPADARDDLRSIVLNFASYYTWMPTRILALERRLTAEIACQDGEIRELTGQPDLIIADPPDGLVIVDWKTGRGVPRSPRTLPPKGEAIVGKQYLSERGHFQLDIYGLLALRHYPQPNRVTLRELHLRTGERREATLGRDELEHVEREVGIQMQKLDEAIRAGEGPLWKPRPGRQCLRRCPVVNSCPVPDEMKGVGALVSEDAADAAAERFIVVDALRQTLRDQLKAHYEESGRPPRVGDGSALFWREKPSGGREFGVFDEADHAPRDESETTA